MINPFPSPWLAEFAPLGECYLWQPNLIWFHAVADGLIALAYLSIPLTLLHVSRRRRDLPFPGIFIMFGAFIIACGLTHVMEIVTIWQPVHWLSGSVKMTTAVISVATAVALARVVPRAITLPSSAELKQLNVSLEERVAARTADLKASNDQLRREVGQREQAEAEIRRLNLTLEHRVAELQALFDVLPIGVGISRDATCRDIRTNRAFATMLGIKPDSNASLSAPAGQAPTNFTVEQAGRVLSPDNLPMQRAVRENVALHNFEESIVHEDGTRIDLVVSALPLRNEQGEAVGAVATFQDITALKAAQDELRLVVDAAPNAILKVESSGLITLVNAQAIALFGYTREEMLGQAVEILVPERYRSGHQTHLGNFFHHPSARAMGAGRELYGRRKDGSEVPIEVGLNPIKTPNGMIALAAIIDVTQRKRAEADRLEFERRLLESQKLESIGVLAGGIAHDFNNLLTGVLGNASLLRLHAGENADKSLMHIDEIERYAQRAAALCRQMLDYSGKGHFVVRPFNPNRMIEQQIPLLKVAVGKMVKLSFDLAEPLRLVRGDAKQLHQALTNLVINASEAIGAQPGEITIRTRLVSIGDDERGRLVAPHELTALSCVSLSVIDTGCGMTSDTLKRAFEPFFTTKFIGRGLGLAAVLGIIRSHKGGILARSNPGSGSEFELLIPALDDSASPLPPRAATPAIGSRGTVLVVDDEDCVRNLASESLIGAGYQVVLAEDGEMAVSLFRINPYRFSAVLLDLKMPRLDGENTFFVLRQIAPDLPVVLTSGFDEELVHQRFLDSGLAAFLPKPFRPATLVATIGEAIQKSRRAR